MRLSLITAIFILLFSNANKAQDVVNHTMRFNWNKKEFVKSDNAVIDDYYLEGAINSRNKLVPLYKAFIEIPYGGEIQVKLTNVEFSSTDIGDHELDLPDDFYVEGVVTADRENYQAAVTITPVRQVDGKIQRLTSCNISLTLRPEPILAARGPERTKKSVLSEGSIFKIAVSESGVYSLTGADLKSLGMNTSGVNPKNIAIFSNYGGPLPEKISDQNPDDLLEIPLLYEGEENQAIDDNDKLFFYLDGPNKWLPSDKGFEYKTNVYDTKNFAYIKVKTEPGKRIQSKGFNASAVISQYYDDFQIFEEERVNLLGINAATEGSGQDWYGEKFTNGEELSLSEKFTFSNRFDSNINIQGRFAARSGNSTKTELTINDKSFTQTYDRVNLYTIESPYARQKEFAIDSEVPGTPAIKLKYSGDGEGWLDYIVIQMKKNLGYTNEVQFLRQLNDVDSPVFGYEFTDLSSDDIIWNITNLDEIYSFEPDQQKISYEPNGFNQTLVRFRKKDAIKPELVGNQENQNLHSLEELDMLVIYHKEFEKSVTKYVEHRKNHSGFNVVAVEVSKIYPEFSSGKQDPSAIRDFVKMLYDRTPNFKYLLLVGDGTYDQRGLMPNLPDHRFIPVYETTQSLNPISAFPTDDYYALLSDQEGLGLNGALDIAVGRLTVTTATEAEDVVNKIIHYETSPNRFGDWRLRSTFTADDEDNNTHLGQMDEIVGNVIRDYPIMNDQKIYFDAYQQEATPGGQRYPEVEAAFKRNMDRGHLTFCYLGHGGPKGWSQERTLKISDIQNWNNFDNQTVIVTATCSFTGYDDPEIKSAGEYALLNRNGGTVALLTTVRAVYASENKRLTESVYENIFQRESNGDVLCLGEAVRIAKNSHSQDTTGENSRKFSLIGDPSMRIGLPKNIITVDQINNTDISVFEDTLSALDEVTISGRIVDRSGKLMDKFNGEIFPTIFDKRSIIETLGNDKGSPKRKIDVQKNIIFKGKATVANGFYSFTFIVPKDINYSIGEGKISLYATDGKTTDAGGFYSGILIGGSNENFTNDSPPIMNVYINDRNFISGQEVLPNSTLLIDLEDDKGINVTGNSIGHDLTADITGPIKESLILNEFYESSLNDFRSGSVTYSLKGLPNGKYTLKAKAWDVANNSTEQTIQFVVNDEKQGEITKVVTYPNPTLNVINFEFEHDLGNTEATVNIDIFNSLGSLVGTIERSMNLTGNKVEITEVDLENEINNHWSTGLYLYKIKVASRALNISRESKFHKFIKLN